MEVGWKTILDEQFQACLEMLERALKACPEALWAEPGRHPAFWYLVFHSLSLADHYLSRAGAHPATPEPFTAHTDTDAPSAPERAYGKAELESYLAHVRGKGRNALELLDDERTRARTPFPPGEPSLLEAIAYATRHTQHHVGQLYLLLRQEADTTPGWIGKSGRSGAGT